MRFWWRQAAIAVIAVGGFALYLVSIVARWPLPVWLYIVGPVVALTVISLLSFRPRRPSRQVELYSSDEYSDVYLGRQTPTHPHRETRAASQVGTGLPPDPLLIPPKERL